MEPEYIERMVRAFQPWPIAWTIWGGKRVKLFNTEMYKCDTDKEAGILFTNDESLLFSTKKKGVCIKVNELQIEGKQRTLAKEFVHGFKDYLK